MSKNIAMGKQEVEISAKKSRYVSREGKMQRGIAQNAIKMGEEMAEIAKRRKTRSE